MSKYLILKKYDLTLRNVEDILGASVTTDAQLTHQLAWVVAPPALNHCESGGPSAQKDA